MQKQGLDSLKPGVNRSVHLLAAAMLWTCVGSLLMVRAWEWIGPGKNRWYVVLALVIGTVKSLAVLDKSARRGMNRIVHMRDGTCLGAIYSWKTWLLVALMISSGVMLRTFYTPGVGIGILYMAVGWALFFSSRLGWQEWFRWIRNKENKE